MRKPFSKKGLFSLVLYVYESFFRMLFAFVNGLQGQRRLSFPIARFY